LIGYAFDREFQLAPGAYTLEVWDGNRLLLAKTFTVFTPGLSPPNNRLASRLEQCPFRRWAPINAVKEFYGFTHDPIEEPSPLAQSPLHRGSLIGSSYYYLLPEYGVVIRFGSDLQMLEIGVRRPFGGKIARVAIGATKDDVRRIRGNSSAVWSTS